MSLPRHTAVLTLSYEDNGLMPTATELADDPLQAVPRIATWLEGLSAGGQVGSVTMLVDDGNAVAATATVAYSSTSGSTQVTVNGVAMASQGSGTDSARAAADAVAINASVNPLVSANVSAAAVGTTLTLTAKRKGAVGNINTLAASGTGLTASGNRLTGGTDATNTATLEH